MAPRPMSTWFPNWGSRKGALAEIVDRPGRLDRELRYAGGIQPKRDREAGPLVALAIGPVQLAIRVQLDPEAGFVEHRNFHPAVLRDGFDGGQRCPRGGDARANTC